MKPEASIPLFYEAKSLTFFAQRSVGEGTAVFFSCSSRQRARETDKAGKGHGVFFHFVLEGLRGAKGATNEKGQVTWERLVPYVKEQVKSEFPSWFADLPDSERQRPHAIGNLVEDPVLIPGSEGAVGTRGVLWDRLGGEKGVRKVVDDFVAATAADPKVDFTRGGKYKLDALKVEDLKKKLVEMLSEATGGPLKYTGKEMKSVHKGMEITNEEFDAAVGHLKAALEKNGIKPTDVDALMRIVNATRKDIVEGKRLAPEPKEGSVTGTVTLDGKPLAKGYIEATQIDRLTGKTAVNSALITDGEFKLRKVEPGVYTVRVLDNTGVPVKYGKSTKSPIIFEVKPGANTIDVKLEGEKKP